MNDELDIEDLKDAFKGITQDLQTGYGLSYLQAILAVWGGLVVGSLILVAIATTLGINSRAAIESGAYWRWTVSIFLYGVIYLVFLWPGAIASIVAAVLGKESRIPTEGTVEKLWPKVASFMATLATGWTLAPISFLAVIPAFVIGGYYAGAMAAGVLSFLIFNRKNRGDFTLWIGCAGSALILIISVLLNVVPMARILYSRHVGPMPVLPGWSTTLFMIAIVAIVIISVLWVARKSLGDSAVKTIITAIVVIVLAAGAFGLLSRGFNALADYGRNDQTTVSNSSDPYLDATNEGGITMGQIGQDGKFRFKVGGSVNFGTSESNGPMGSSWHTGAKYGDQTRRPDLPTGCILLQVGQGRTTGLAELTQTSNGLYEISGIPGENVTALLNESAGNYANNTGGFNILPQ